MENNQFVLKDQFTCIEYNVYCEQFETSVISSAINYGEIHITRLSDMS